MLKCESITKGFGAGTLRREVLRSVSLTCAPGEKCVLVGPSGSGKTTLLSVLGCITSPCSGSLHINGQRVDHSKKGQMVAFRRCQIGFVFQRAQLLPFLSMEENVWLVARNAGMKRHDAAPRILELFDRLGIGHIRRKSAHEASGGEKQRVAVVRAIVHHPSIIIADEPTAALDWDNAQAVIHLLSELAQREGCVLVTATHDTRLLSVFDRRLRIEQGSLLEE